MYNSSVRIVLIPPSCFTAWFAAVFNVHLSYRHISLGSSILGNAFTPARVFEVRGTLPTSSQAKTRPLELTEEKDRSQRSSNRDTRL